MNKRAGFSLVEVVVALVLLSVSVLGAQLLAATMLRRMTTSGVQMSAVQLAEDRLDRIRLEPNYGALPSYAGTDTAIAGFPNFTRVTTVTRQLTTTTNGTTDFRTVTVQVTGRGLPAPVRRTLVIAAP